MASRKDIAAGGATIEIRALNYTKKVFAEVSNNLNALGANAAKIGASMAAGATASALALTALATTSASAAAAIDDAAMRTGAGAEALQELRYAGELSDASFEGIVKGFKKLSSALSTEDGRKQLEQLGLSVSDLAGMSPEQQFYAVADAIAALGDTAAARTAAMEIFGDKIGPELYPMLSEGAAGIQAMGAEARALGQVLGSDSISALAQFDDIVAKVTGTIKGLAIQLSAQLMPYLIPIGQYVAEIVGGFSKWLAANQGLGGAILGTIVAVGAAGVALFAFGTGLVAVGTILGSAMAAFSAFGAVAAAVFSPIGIGVAIVTAFAAAAIAAAGAVAFFALPFTDLDSIIEAVSGAVDWLNGALAALVATVNSYGGDALSGIVDAFANADLKSAAEIAFMGVQIAAAHALEYVLGTVRAVLKSIDDAYRTVAKNTTLGGFAGTELGLESYVNSETGLSGLEQITASKRQALQQQVSDEAAAQAKIRSLREISDRTAAAQAESAAFDAWMEDQMYKLAPVAAALNTASNPELDLFSAGAGTSAAGVASFMGGVSMFAPLETEAKKQTAHLAQIAKNTRDGMGVQID